ncbi:hypothetical protein LTR65_008958 [Meristemomyces frigidus]
MEELLVAERDSQGQGADGESDAGVVFYTPVASQAAGTNMKTAASSSEATEMPPATATQPQEGDASRKGHGYQAGGQPEAQPIARPRQDGVDGCQRLVREIEERGAMGHTNSIGQLQDKGVLLEASAQAQSVLWQSEVRKLERGMRKQVRFEEQLGVAADAWRDG